MSALTETVSVAPPRPAQVAMPGEAFTGHRYLQLVLILGSLATLGPLTIDTYLPALPTLTAQLGATDSEAQLTLTGLLLGLGLGQLVIGPISDTVGRRRPLIIGLAAHAAMSVLCALAPTIEAFTATRVLQGLAGAAVAVVGMAMVRDLFTGLRAAQLLSRLVLVLGVAPILAPSLGSALLEITSWRGIFVFVALGAVALLLVAVRALPETLPPARRRVASASGSARAYLRVLADPVFIGMVLVASLVFSAIFGYVAGSSFVLQGQFGMSPAEFGVAFAANAAGMILMTQVNPLLVRRWGPARILRSGVLVSLLGTSALVLTSLTTFGGLVGFVVPMWVAMAGFGLSMPNAPALALSRHGEAAGTAAAVLGAAQFGIGGLTSPLVGLLGDGTALPMASIMATAMVIATLILFGVRKQLAAQPVD